MFVCYQPFGNWNPCCPQVCKDAIVACHALVPCGHVFCGPCIGDWLQRQFNCPVCRCAGALSYATCWRNYDFVSERLEDLG